MRPASAILGRVDAQAFSPRSAVFLAAVLLVAARAPPETGEFVITPQFDRAESFSEGLAMVRIGDYPIGKSGYIDRHGTMVITPRFDAAGSFGEGFAAVRIGDTKTGKFGFIDKQGRMVITPQFDAAESFSEGLAVVGRGGYLTGKGYIETLGKMFINPRFRLESLSLRGQLTRGKVGFIDRTGRIAIDLQFGQARPFSEGLATVEIGPSPIRTAAGVLLGTGDPTKNKWGSISR